VHVAFGRWIDLQSKIELDLFYTERKPIKRLPLGEVFLVERSSGFAVDFMQLPIELPALAGALGEMRGRVALEYVRNINYSNRTSMRALFQLVFGLTPSWPSLQWQ
jgi:hypothetical protein